MPTPSSSSSRNLLLARLSANDYQRLLFHFKTLRLRTKHVLLKPHHRSEHVYFLGGGVCSITQGTVDGQTAGVALVGNEGLIGLTAFGGDPESGVTAVVEIAGGIVQVMNMGVFRREMAQGGALHDLVHRYMAAFSASLMQSVMCNALHSVEMRCARCLLEIRDRFGHNELPLTQYTLAGLLGVRRATVTLCAGDLHHAGLVEKQHKHIVIKDPVRLEAAACECYNVIKEHFARLLE